MIEKLKVYSIKACLRFKDIFGFDVFTDLTKTLMLAFLRILFKGGLSNFA